MISSELCPLIGHIERNCPNETIFALRIFLTDSHRVRIITGMVMLLVICIYASRPVEYWDWHQRMVGIQEGRLSKVNTRKIFLHSGLVKTYYFIGISIKRLGKWWVATNTSTLEQALDHGISVSQQILHCPAARCLL